MARISVFSREIDLLLARHLSPQARQRAAAQYARKLLAEAQQTNQRALGAIPPHRTFVDGRAGAALESVNPDHGRIVFRFELSHEMLRWIGEQLVTHSPFLTGQYARSHVLLADGVEIDADGKIPQAETYLFVNSVPYARKIERGYSDDAPEGVYEVVSALATRRFGNIANIRFTYRSLLLPYIALGGRRGGKTASPAKRSAHYIERETRNPAISVRLR